MFGNQTQGQGGDKNYSSLLVKLGKKDQQLLSPSSSLEFDSYDLLEDEMLKGFQPKNQMKDEH